MGIDKKITKYLIEADMEARQARARLAGIRLTYNTIENIIDEATEKADAQMEAVVEKIATIYKKAVADVVKEIDEANDATEGAWGISSSSVDKFFKDMYQKLVVQYVMERGVKRATHPIVEAFWEAVDEEWIEKSK